ncbi:hypothetical protein [Streptomyces coerulescens]|uniref:Uncharacterized protein n=1 Tax=Streptomyces coerulescens TaxID=29304 RepID=A0ABW0CRP4_STRCD
MITQVEHSSAGTGAADLALALAIAGALNPPTAPPRAPELATTAPPSAGRRTSAGRGRRRTVRG